MVSLVLALGGVGYTKQEFHGPFRGGGGKVGWTGLAWGLRAQLTHESTHVANEAEEAALWGICATLAGGGGQGQSERGAGALAPLFWPICLLLYLCLFLSRQATDL